MFLYSIRCFVLLKNTPVQNTCKELDPTLCVIGLTSTRSIDHAHLTVVFTTSDHIPTLLKLKQKVPMLKMIVSIDDLSEDGKRILGEWGQTQNVKVTEMQECG